jgi:hypothetical protein
MPAKAAVRLSDDERRRLDRLTRVGAAHARSIQHARILLLADEADVGPAWTDEKVADALACGVATVARVRKRFLSDGLEAAVRPRREAPGRPPKIDGAAEAHLIALACSAPPEGHARWSLRLLTDRFVELALAEGRLERPVSHETVRQVLKKTRSARTGRRAG